MLFVRVCYKIESRIIGIYEAEYMRTKLNANQCHRIRQSFVTILTAIGKESGHCVGTVLFFLYLEIIL